MKKQLLLLGLLLMYSSAYPIYLEGPEVYQIKVDAHIKNSESYRREFSDLLESFCKKCPFPGRHKSSEEFVDILNDFYQACNDGDGRIR